MKYLKPLRFFKATQNVRSRLAKGSLVSLNVTDKYLSMASTDNSKEKLTAYNEGFMPRSDDTLPNLLRNLQTKMLENGLAGIIIGKKNGDLDYFNTFLETRPNPEKYFGPYR